MRLSTISTSSVLAFAFTIMQSNVQAAAAGAEDAFPVRPVRIILASGAGSSPDVIGRLLANRLSQAWNQPVIVDNRPGATGLIAVEKLANSAPDGHTLGMFTLTNLIAMLMYQKYMLATELGAVTLVGTTPFAFVVNSNTPVKNIAEWIAYAKARPGQLRYGSTGKYGSLHLCMENFNALTGLKMLHVPYKSAVPAMADVINGSIHVLCPAAPMLPPYIKSGKIRTLGITYREPSKLMSGVPPVSETVSGFSLYGWYGMHVPPNTPPGIVKKINLEVVKALKDPKLAKVMFITGAEAAGSTPAEYAERLKKDTDHWTKLLKASGAKLGQVN
jgi:tripartite-type tricarboxylate transporter receptor subunit TctC